MESALRRRGAGVTAAGRERQARMLLLTAAAISFVLSVSLWYLGHEMQGIFVGLWVPSILSLGSIVLHPGARQSSSVGLFLVGAFVSLLVIASVALLSWGAVLDGRYEQERQIAESEASTRTDDEPPLAAAFEALPSPRAH